MKATDSASFVTQPAIKVVSAQVQPTANALISSVWTALVHKKTQIVDPVGS